jgi:hypothetical protein
MAKFPFSNQSPFMIKGMMVFWQSLLSANGYSPKTYQHVAALGVLQRRQLPCRILRSVSSDVDN